MEIIFDVDAKYVGFEPVGSGAYGQVCSVTDTKENRRVAIKKIDFNHSRIDVRCGLMLRSLREIRILRRLQHGNIITLFDVIVPSIVDSVYLIESFMESTLHQLIREGKEEGRRLSSIQVKSYAHQILKAIRYMHRMNVIHRDLKPSNILIDSSNHLKICDFGLARSNLEVDGQLTAYVATRPYRAPEIVLLEATPGSYTNAVDIWSFGCILAEMKTGNTLVRGHNPFKQLEVIVELVGTPSEEDLQFIQDATKQQNIRDLGTRQPQELALIFPDPEDSQLVDLLHLTLQFNPKKRASADESLKHEYFRDLPSETEIKVDPINDDIQLVADSYEMASMRLSQLLRSEGHEPIN